MPGDGHSLDLPTEYGKRIRQPQLAEIEMAQSGKRISG